MEKYIIFLLVAVFIASSINQMYHYIVGRNSLRKCIKFGEKTQNGEVNLFFNYKGKVCGYDCDGDPILKQGFVNEKNEEVDFLPDIRKKILPVSLKNEGVYPSRAYHVGIYEVSLKCETDGSYTYPPVVEISLQPLSGCCDEWTVVDTDTVMKDDKDRKLHFVRLKHPVMGTLIYPRGFFERELKDADIHIGKIIMLEQTAQQHSDNLWSITYSYGENG